MGRGGSAEKFELRKRCATCAFAGGSVRCKRISRSVRNECRLQRGCWQGDRDLMLSGAENGCCRAREQFRQMSTDR